MDVAAKDQPQTMASVSTFPKEGRAGRQCFGQAIAGAKWES